MCSTTSLRRTARARSRPVWLVVGACLTLCLGMATPTQARLPLELDQLDLAVRPTDVAPAKPALDVGIQPAPGSTSEAGLPPNPVDEVDKLAPRRVPNRKLEPSSRLGELTGQEGQMLLQEFLQNKTIPLFRLNSSF